MVPDEQKFEPRSKGITTARKKKPKELAVITECCTGCAGSPACVEYCPVEDCMFWVPDEDNPPFGRIQIDPIVHRLQEVPQQRSRRLLPGWLPLGRHCHGGYRRSGKRSRPDGVLSSSSPFEVQDPPHPVFFCKECGIT